MTTTRRVILAAVIVGAGFAVAQARLGLDRGDMSPVRAPATERPRTTAPPSGRSVWTCRSGPRRAAPPHPGDAMAGEGDGHGFVQGVPLATMRQLARYWATDYDWRKAEARLNAMPQFITAIDGLEIHFIHVRSKHHNALPLIVTHGWPGSIIEQLKIIDPLDNPTAHGGERRGCLRRGDPVDARLRRSRASRPAPAGGPSAWAARGPR